MRGYLLDTNHLSHAIRVVAPLRDRLRQAHRQGNRLITCWPVLCELEAGIVLTADPEQYRRTLDALMSDIRIWPMDWGLVHQFGTVSKTVRQRGRVLSLADTVLAAFASKENVILLTADTDFEAVPEISTENWLL
jgi:predicted nucleic acid-binding protein